MDGRDRHRARTANQRIDRRRLNTPIGEEPSEIGKRDLRIIGDLRFSGNVTWQQKGTATNRYVVVSWNGVYQYNTSTPYALQVILD